jgi:nicotinamide-nucleotide amidase
MRCEVIAIGTELLLGQIVDTNSAWIGEQLALAGIDCYYHTHVGDNLVRMVNALRIALDRSDAVIVCGGLGPTHDDITREAISQVMGVPLVRDESLAERVRSRFIARGREMPPNNLRQADVPQGASIIPQMPGTAPGLICPLDGKMIYAVPGVPYEMQEMINGTIIPDLQRRAGAVAVIESRTLRTWGLSESELAELLVPRIAELDKIGNPTLAFLASGIEGIKVRITVKAQDQPTAQRILDEEDSRLRAILGDLVFGVDGQTMESVVVDLLRERNLKLAVAESITGGLLSARVTAVPRADEVLRGGTVLVSGEAKANMPGISAFPSEPEAAAKALALAVCRMFQSDVGLAATGTSALTKSSAPAVITVFLGVAINGRAEVRMLHLPGDRERVRQFTVINLLNLLRLKLAARNAS